MSPSASWAKSVMPIRTEPSASPGLRTHSCSLVYLRSSGYTTLLGAGGFARRCRLSGARGLCVRRCAGVPHTHDLDPVTLLDRHLASDIADLGDEAAGEVHCRGQRVRVSDRVDDERGA